jgi:hypothetical protein
MDTGDLWAFTDELKTKLESGQREERGTGERKPLPPQGISDRQQIV